MGTKFRLRQFFLTGAMLSLLAACVSFKGRTLVVDVTEKIAKTESSFQGIKARGDEDGAKRDRLVLDIHYNDWLGNRQNVNTGWRSIGYNLNFMYDLPLNKKSTKSFGVGLRFGKSVVQHDGLFAIDESTANSILMPTIGSSFNRTNQRFVRSFLELPMELRFRGDIAKSYRFSLGTSIGLHLNSYERWKEGEHKFREYNHPNVPIWRAGVYARVGYGRWSFYGAYDITPMFISNADSKLNTWQAGIGWIIF